jgi:hypothetical protein
MHQSLCDRFSPLGTLTAAVIAIPAITKLSNYSSQLISNSIPEIPFHLLIISALFGWFFSAVADVLGEDMFGNALSCYGIRRKSLVFQCTQLGVYASVYLIAAIILTMVVPVLEG